MIFEISRGKPPKFQRGNIFFILLLCIVAFVALVYAVRGSTDNGKNASAEKAQLAQAQADNCTAQVENAVGRLKIINSCTDDEISYELPNGDNANPDAPTDKRCHVFHPNGAGAAPCGAYMEVAGCDMTVLTVGQAGCGVVYAGMSGGKRIYVMNTTYDADNMEWGPTGTSESASSSSNGKANTDTLVALGSQYTAANFCRNMGPDWYLPAPLELDDIRSAGQTYVPQNEMTWTSQRINATNAGLFFFSGGNLFSSTPTAINKTAAWYVKCVRSD